MNINFIVNEDIFTEQTCAPAPYKTDNIAWHCKTQTGDQKKYFLKQMDALNMYQAIHSGPLGFSEMH